ncbi:aprataxin [Anthonomus grandis grandis]|uniref:aprataxin n=1 Tax=Anthonomus grandis grandis TaxID=2921223 RepID=UPI0021652AB8|nr:aprataxin [Anthonomus grandis grandis]
MVVHTHLTVYCFDFVLLKLILLYGFMRLFPKFPAFLNRFNTNCKHLHNRNSTKMQSSLKMKLETQSQSEPKKPHWALGLTKTIKDHKYIVKSDDKATIIKDMFPKARFHYLVIPKKKISNPKSCTPEHLPLLEHMEAMAREYVESNHPEVNFNVGYHAQSSMHLLHLHVISDDMDSPCVKTKKHWNSFTTEYFVKSDEFIENLKKCGKVVLPSKEKCKEYVGMPLKCHKCDFMPKNMPHLKKHIIIHLKK